jgi:hypothetical protein
MHRDVDSEASSVPIRPASNSKFAIQGLRKVLMNPALDRPQMQVSDCSA